MGECRIWQNPCGDGRLGRPAKRSEANSLREALGTLALVSVSNSVEQIPAEAEQAFEKSLPHRRRGRRLFRARNRFAPEFDHLPRGCFIPEYLSGGCLLGTVAADPGLGRAVFTDHVRLLSLAQ